ncbi:hypothetical protein [Cupriavidus pinatubonensis]|uniref:Uncharacterized protein n=1 Tax=Cupriavidus pinatubonensis TaxID=248026 RepID=A0ABN7YBH2_9BURK|nr:hypothetical protein [Cupriavidus pinatubonensis]CAG9170061.1 hypothetical protein LMG23994_01800 [Cupriavidus pinatubonensis]
MPREIGKSWERFGRRFVLRLSLKRPEEAVVMDEYDRRSALLGKDDKEFLKSCLVAGYKVLVSQAFDTHALALSNNESNNTQKEQGSVLANESLVEQVSQSRATGAAIEPSLAEVADAQASKAVPARAFLGGLMKHG